MATKSKKNSKKTVKSSEVINKSESVSEKAVVKPNKLVIKKETIMKFAIGFGLAILLVPMVDWLVQTSIVSKYVAFYGSNDITRKEYLTVMENQYGTDVAKSLVAKASVRQEAKNKNITVSKEEVDASIKELRAQYGLSDDAAYVSALAENGMTEEDFRNETEIVLTLNKIVADQVKEPTQSEVEKYFADNKDTLYKDKKYEDVKSQIALDIKKADANSKGQAWVATQVEDYPVGNLLVTKENKSYKFLRSYSLLKQLFAK